MPTDRASACAAWVRRKRAFVPHCDDTTKTADFRVAERDEGDFTGKPTHTLQVNAKPLVPLKTLFSDHIAVRLALDKHKDSAGGWRLLHAVQDLDHTVDSGIPQLSRAVTLLFCFWEHIFCIAAIE